MASDREKDAGKIPSRLVDALEAPAGRDGATGPGGVSSGEEEGGADPEGDGGPVSSKRGGGRRSRGRGHGGAGRGGPWPRWGRSFPHPGMPRAEPRGLQRAGDSAARWRGCGIKSKMEHEVVKDLIKAIRDNGLGSSYFKQASSLLPVALEEIFTVKQHLSNSPGRNGSRVMVPSSHHCHDHSGTAVATASCCLPGHTPFQPVYQCCAEGSAPHLLAAETYKEFERTYIPEDQRHTNKNSQVAFCYSEAIPAPVKKDDAQQKSDIELLQFSLVLIQSWLTPVQYLSKMFTNNLVFGTSDRVYEKLKDLEEGIQALMRELQDRSFRGPQILKAAYEKFDIHLRSEDALLQNYGLLSCFKKDLHKVETYLKVMKCRRYGEGNCTI
ncbi:LOW QUALITY PROTEIN: somatotropin [Lonchura striata]